MAERWESMYSGCNGIDVVRDTLEIIYLLCILIACLIECVIKEKKEEHEFFSPEQKQALKQRYSEFSSPPLVADILDLCVLPLRMQSMARACILTSRKEADLSAVPQETPSTCCWRPAGRIAFCHSRVLSGSQRQMQLSTTPSQRTSTAGIALETWTTVTTLSARISTAEGRRGLALPLRRQALIASQLLRVTTWLQWIAQSAFSVGCELCRGEDSSVESAALAVRRCCR